MHSYKCLGVMKQGPIEACSKSPQEVWVQEHGIPKECVGCGEYPWGLSSGKTESLIKWHLKTTFIWGPLLLQNESSCSWTFCDLLQLGCVPPCWLSLSFGEWGLIVVRPFMHQNLKCQQNMNKISGAERRKHMEITEKGYSYSIWWVAWISK